MLGKADSFLEKQKFVDKYNEALKVINDAISLGNNFADKDKGKEGREAREIVKSLQSGLGEILQSAGSMNYLEEVNND